MAEIKLKVDHALVLRPGDKLVLGVRDNMTDEQHGLMVEYAEQYLPGVQVLVFPNVQAMAVYRETGE